MDQLVRYGIVGAVNATADYVVLNVCLLLFGVSLFWATFFGFVVGGILGYFLHSRWTFKYDTSGKETKKLAHFLFIAFVGLTLTEVIVHLLTNRFGLYYNYSKAVALIIAVSWAYSASKWWVFRQQDQEQV